MYEKAFELGLRLPLPSLVKEVLGHFKIAPCQLMPNAWLILLGFQVLSEICKVDASLKVFCYSYILSRHGSEKGRVSIGIRSGMEPLVPHSPKSIDSSWKKRYILLKDDCVFGPEGLGKVLLFWQTDKGPIDNNFPEELVPSARSVVRKLLRVPWSERQSVVLLTPTSLAETSIWSSCIALSGLKTSAFVREFEAMEKARVRSAPRFKEFLARNDSKKRAKKSKKSATGTSIIPAGLTDVVPSTRVTPRKGKAAEQVQPLNGGGRVDLGKGIALLVDPFSFQMGDRFKLVEDIGGIRGEGPSSSTDYAISLLARGLQAVIALKEDVHEYETSTRGLKEEITSLRTSNAALEMEVSRANAKVQELEDLLGQEKDASSRLRIDWKRKEEEAMIYARRDLMEEILAKKHLEWDPVEEIARCDDLLDGLLDAKGGGDAEPATMEDDDGSYEDDPTA